MPKITDIKTQINNQDKVSVYLDGKYRFSLTISRLAENKKVRVGSVLTEQELEEFKKLSQLTNQYIRMVGLIYARPRSEYEIRTKLRTKRIEADEIEELIIRLKSAKYLDDEKFAEWWVSGRKGSRPISTLKLKSELTQKGISQDIVSSAISNNFSEDDELQALKKLIQAKKDKYDTEQKLMAFLASRGFKYSQIKDALSSSEKDF